MSSTSPSDTSTLSTLPTPGPAVDDISESLELDALRAENAKLRKINQALIGRVERSMEQQGDGFSLFQTAIHLERQIRRRTQELSATLAHLQRSNHELKSAKDIAERANLSKSHFLAAASHDVLQPLNAALLLTSSLHAAQNDNEGRRLCQQVERSLDTMSTLLRTLLTMSRLDAGDIQPVWQSVSLDELFDSVVSDAEPLARQKGLQLRVRHSGLYVHSDPTMLRRIVQNIVANAIRYTVQGGVLLIAHQMGDQVRIRIADTGVGIPEDQYQEIFVEFHRCPDPSQATGDAQRSWVEGTSRRESDEQQQAPDGLGLGLAIVDRMVNTLDHRITLNSRVGRGSCFQLRILAAEPPVAHHEAISTAPPSSDNLNQAGLAGARVLVIENDLLALDAMQSLMQRWGCELRLANSTHEALSAITSTRWQPDLIVADQHLDSDDLGTTTVELARTLTGRHVPAIIVTANPSRGLTRITEEMDIEMLLKPIKPAQLRALLTHLYSASTTPT